MQVPTKKIRHKSHQVFLQPDRCRRHELWKYSTTRSAQGVARQIIGWTAIQG